MRETSRSDPTMSMVDADPYADSYPESDGEPMAEGDEQGNAIRLLMGGFRNHYRDQPDIHVSGDLLWYPVPGNPRISAAPDVMVIEGCARDQALRRYVAWEHGGSAPALVVEVLSPTNGVVQMIDKLSFYDRHGVGEYVFVDPFQQQIRAWVRRGGSLVSEMVTGPWTSPFSSVSFSFDDLGLNVSVPGGRRWLLPEDEIHRAELEAQRAELEAARADAAEGEIAELRARLARLQAER